MKRLTFIDFFAGIGGFRLGLEMAGHKCIGFCEKDKFAVRSYRAMYDTEGEWYGEDITALGPGDIPYADIWTAGSPCQNLSIAGRRSGLHGDRSSLFFNFTSLLKGKAEEDKPEWVILENVKGLLSSNRRWDFLEYLYELAEAGYDVGWAVYNSKDHGVPQNRERVYTVGHLRSRGGGAVLPVPGKNGAALKELVGGMQGYRVYDPSGISATLGANGGGMGAKTGLYFIDQTCCNPKITENARCLIAKYNAGITNRKTSSGVLEVHAFLTPDRLEKRQNGRRMKEDGEPMFTLTGQDRHGVYFCDRAAGGGTQTGLRYGRIRRLTPRECFRLQGFPDELFERAASVNSDTQLYKQAGNAVTVTVAYAVAMALPESQENEIK